MPMKHVEKHACSYKQECTSVVRAKQKYMHAVHVNHNANSSRLKCYVYTHALNIHFYVIDLSYTWKPCDEHFQKCVEPYGDHTFD